MSVARTYASALYLAAKEVKNGSDLNDKIEAQLKEVSGWINGSKEMRVALISPVVSAAEKASIVEALAKKADFYPLVTKFLALLAKKDRFAALSEIVTAFRQVRTESEGGILGTVVSADPVLSADIEALAKDFGLKLGRKVAFDVSVDPELLAGMKVTVAGVTYDGTLSSQIRRMRDGLGAAVVSKTNTIH